MTAISLSIHVASYDINGAVIYLPDSYSDFSATVRITIYFIL